MFIKKISFITLFVFLASSSMIEGQLDKTVHKELDFDLDQVTVVKSLIDSSTITEIVKKQYHLEGPIKSKLISIGINDMYLIETASEKFILRLSRVEKYATMTEDEFLFELEWLDFLYQNQIPVAHPIRRIDQDFWGLIKAPEGFRFVTLFTFAQGSTVLDVDKAFILGKTLAEIHLVSDSFKTSLPRAHLGLQQLVEEPVKRIQAVLKDYDLQKSEQLDVIAKEVTDAILSLEPTEGDYGIINGDIHGFNQHFTEDNQVTLFDFEFCVYGYRLLDIATFRWSRGRDNLELWHAFLAGYQSVRPLSQKELLSIPAFVKARNIWTIDLVLTLPESNYNMNENYWEKAFNRFIPKETKALSR